METIVDERDAIEAMKRLDTYTREYREGMAKRRHKGEGHIFQNAPGGTYFVQIRIDGRKVVRSAGTNVLADAIKMEKAANPQYCSLNFVAQAVEPAEPRFISAFLAALDQR